MVSLAQLVRASACGAEGHRFEPDTGPKKMVIMDKNEWNPGYYDKYNRFIPYEKAWYCNANKLIHYSEKEYLNCIHCNKKR